MVIGFGKYFDTARLNEILKAFNNFGSVLLKLVYGSARQGKTHLKLALITLNKAKQKGVHGQIALLGYFTQNSAILLFVLIKRRVTNVEKGIFAQPVGLVNLKIKTNTQHGYLLKTLR